MLYCCLSLMTSALSAARSRFKLSTSPASLGGPRQALVQFLGGATIWGLEARLLLIFFSKCFWPARKDSFANSQRSGFTFLNPCTTGTEPLAFMQEATQHNQPFNTSIRSAWPGSQSNMRRNTKFCNIFSMSRAQIIGYIHCIMVICNCGKKIENKEKKS